MRLKDDTVNPDFVPPLVLGLLVADQVYREHDATLVITSGRDGKHSPTSLHYAGAAADLRIWGLRHPDTVAAEIRGRLNHHYDVILENDHIHLEWQPRQPMK